MAWICGHYQESSDSFEYPKKSLLKSSHPKKYTVSTKVSHSKKSWKKKILSAKKSFYHPHHSKSRDPPIGDISSLITLKSQ